MAITPVGSSRQGSYEGAKGGQLPQLPVGTPLSAQIVARLENNLLRLITQLGPLLVEADAETAARLPASGTLHLAVAGHDRGAIQLHVLPGEGERASGPLPILREVTGQAAQRALQGQPQAAPLNPPAGQTQAGPALPRLPLQPGVQVPATLTVQGSQQQIVTPQGAFRLEAPLPFPPESKLILIPQPAGPQPGGQSLRIVPLATQASATPANPYQAAAGQPQLVFAKAVEVPMASLKPVLPTQVQAGKAATAVEGAARAALAAQASLAPLFQSLGGLARSSAQSPAQSAQGAAIAALAAQVLGLRLSPEKGITGQDLRQAFQRGGTGHEALVARGQPQLAATDLKSLLMRLLDGLKAMPEAKPASAPPQAEGARPLPPQRGTLFEAPPSQLAQGGGADAPSLARVLQEVEGALARLKLLQFASLPEAGESRPDTTGREGQVRREMQLEIPFVLHGGRTTMMQVQVESEGRSHGQDAPQGRDWRLSFSLQLGAQGAVNAQVSLRLARFGILLWAEDGELRAAMRENIQRLHKALKEMQLDVAELEIRKFPLPQARGHRPGVLMDALS